MVYSFQIISNTEITSPNVWRGIVNKYQQNILFYGVDVNILVNGQGYQGGTAQVDNGYSKFHNYKVQ